MNSTAEKVMEIVIKSFLSDTSKGKFKKDKDKMYQEMKMIYEEEPNEEIRNKKIKNYINVEERVTEKTIVPTKKELWEIKKFKYISYGYAALSVVVLFLSGSISFFPLLFVWFIVGLFLPKITKDKIRYGKYESRSTVFTGLAVLTGGVFMFASTDNLLNFPFLFLIICGILSLIPLYLITRAEEFSRGEIDVHKLMSYLSIPAYYILLVGFLFDTGILMNTLYDNSEPQIYTTQILTKTYSYDDEDNEYYKIHVEKWHEDFDDNFIYVGVEKYDSLSEGDEVNVLVKGGFLGFSWYAME